MDDLAVIVVSTNEAQWLRACLTSVFEHRGACSLDVVVADNGSTDGTAELVTGEFPQARVVACVNRGFAHANNRALETTNARYALFLNPDTEIRTGTFEALMRHLDEHREVGLAGVGLGRLGGAIARGPALYDVGYIDVVAALQSDRGEHVVKQLAGLADEGLPARILFGTGTFADEQPFGALVTHAEYCLASLLVKDARSAGGNRGFELLPVHCADLCAAVNRRRSSRLRQRRQILGHGALKVVRLLFSKRASAHPQRREPEFREDQRPAAHSINPIRIASSRPPAAG